jgi:superoxide dismutase, Fe-Mn family
MEYTLPKLGYAYDALEPYIDAQTMEIHYTKHHQAYITNLNKLLVEHPELQKYSLEELVCETGLLDPAVALGIRNQGGGHANHTFFWTIMAPRTQSMPTAPVGTSGQAITKKFSTFDKFKETFDAAAKSVFGSGWAWLCVHPRTKEITLITTPNQDSPLMQGLIPFLGLDVWEHAYYLKYQNRRPDYISSWWNVVNWDMVEQYYKNALNDVK